MVNGTMKRIPQTDRAVFVVVVAFFPLWVVSHADLICGGVIRRGYGR